MPQKNSQNKYLSHDSYSFRSSYGSFSYNFFSYNSFSYNSFSHNQFVQNSFDLGSGEFCGDYKYLCRQPYKNEYLYQTCNIKQEFFVMGYGLGLV